MPKPFVRSPKVDAMLKALRALEKQDVLVGIPAENAGRKEGTITNAELGYIMETGSPINNIPARPFLVPGVEHGRSRFAPHMEAAVRAVLNGDAPAVNQSLRRAGNVAVAAVKRELDSNIPPPLAESTLRKRRSRGSPGGEKTLLDTGQMRNAVTFVVTDNTGGSRRKRKGS